MITIIFRDIERLWSRFRDYRPVHHQDIHLDYSVKIQQAMGENDVNASLRILTEAILFFNMPEDANAFS